MSRKREFMDEMNLVGLGAELVRLITLHVTRIGALGGTTAVFCRDHAAHLVSAVVVHSF